jgi:chaperonin GroES
MNIRPLHDRIIARRLEEGEPSIGGIIIPDTAKEKPQQGTVIAAGNGRAKDDGVRVPLDVKAGDRILFGKYAGQEITLEGDEYLIIKEEEVLAVVGNQTRPARGTLAGRAGKQPSVPREKPRKNALVLKGKPRKNAPVLKGKPRKKAPALKGKSKHKKR